MKKWIACMLLVLAAAVWAQAYPSGPMYGAERLEPAPEFAVQLVQDRFIDVFARLEQDGVTLDWDRAWANMQLYRLAPHASFEVWIPASGRSDLAFSALVWNDRAYNPRLYVQARPGFWAGWSLQFLRGSDPFSSYLHVTTQAPRGGSLRPKMTSSQVRMLFARMLPHAYQAFYVSKVTAAR